jgi:transcriptional regulator with GAF, ATPase, and Fis domain
VTSTTNQSQLFSKLIDGSLYVTEADMGWVLVRSEDSDQLILRAERNMPAGMSPRLQQAFDDGVSSLVMLSGETLAVQGEGLSKFKLAQFCSTALIAPIKVKDQPIGVLCVAREHERSFSDRQQVMLEAVADYASISLVNARLFQALEERAKRLEREMRKSAAGVQNEQNWLSDIHRSLRAALAEIGEYTPDEPGDERERKLSTVRHDIESVLKEIDDILDAKESS